jgi:hypothetical protein
MFSIVSDKKFDFFKLFRDSKSRFVKCLNHALQRSSGLLGLSKVHSCPHCGKKYIRDGSGLAIALFCFTRLLWDRNVLPVDGVGGEGCRQGSGKDPGSSGKDPGSMDDDVVMRDGDEGEMNDGGGLVVDDGKSMAWEGLVKHHLAYETTSGQGAISSFITSPVHYHVV